MKKLNFKKLSKLFVLLLSVVLAVTALVVSVSAEEAVPTKEAELYLDDSNTPAGEYDTLWAALSAAKGKAKSTIKLLKDTTMTFKEYRSPGNNCDLSIDLNGHSLTLSTKQADGSYGRVFIMTNANTSFSFIGHGNLIIDVDSKAFYESNPNMQKFAIQGTTGYINVSFAEKSTLFNFNAKENIIENVNFDIPAVGQAKLISASYNGESNFKDTPRTLTIKNVTFNTQAADQNLIYSQAGTFVTIENVTVNAPKNKKPIVSNDSGVSNFDIKNMTINSPAMEAQNVFIMAHGSNFKASAVTVNAPNCTGQVFYQMKNGTVGGEVDISFCNINVKSASLLGLGSDRYPSKINISNILYNPTDGGKLSSSGSTHSAQVSIVDSYILENKKTEASNVIAANKNRDDTTGGTITENETYTEYKPNGTAEKGSPALMTAYGYGDDTSIAAYSNKNGGVAVHSIDIGSSLGKLTTCNIGVTRRSAKGDLNVLPWRIEPGVLKPIAGKGVEGGAAQFDIAPDQTFTFTIVIDLAGDDGYTIYAFADDTYMGKVYLNDNLDAYFVGIYFSVNTVDTTSNLILSNSVSKAYSGNIDSQGKNNAFGESSARYYAFGAGETAYNITVGGIPVPDLSKALYYAKYLDMKAELVGNVKDPQRATLAGFIKLNNYTLAIAPGSMPSEMGDDVIEFHTRIDGISANVGLYAGFGVNLYVPSEYTVDSATVNGIAFTAAPVTLGGVSYNKITVYVNADDAAEELPVVLKLSKDGYSYAARTVKISVLSYAKKVLKEAEADSYEVKLMTYMLAYANEACKYFDGRENADIAAQLPASLQSFDTSADVITTNNKEELAAAVSSIAIDLNTKNLAYIFSVAEDFGGSVTVSLGGKSETATAGQTLKLDGLKIYNFAGEVTISVKSGEADAVVYKYNLATLLDAYKTLSDAEGGEAYKAVLPLIQRLSDYAEASKAYNANKAQQ